MPALRVLGVLRRDPVPRRTSSAIPAVVALAAAILVATLAAPPVRAPATRVAVATALAWPVSFAFVPPGAPLGPLRAPAGTIVYDELFTGDLRAVANGQDLGRVGNVSAVSNGEQGLLGLALDPAYRTSPWAYVYYTYLNATLGAPLNRVSRLWLGTPGLPGPPVEEILLDGIPAATNHNGGILGFAPDGTLFATTGDARVPSNAQDNASLSGKVLRIDRDGSIPADNPVPGSPVYTLGHRNVFGLAFHPVTGTPYVSENGPTQDDEVNVLEAGRNYGWPLTTGAAGDPRFVDPILTYATVIAPTGLAFYTGTVSSAWADALFLGDWNHGDLHRLTLAGPPYRQVLGDVVEDSVGSQGVLDVEDGPDGYLYESTTDAIYRLNATASPPPGGPAVTALPLGPILIAIGIAVVGVLFLIAVARERRRRSPPPG